jgi:hypothetical protein
MEAEAARKKEVATISARTNKFGINPLIRRPR